MHLRTIHANTQLKFIGLFSMYEILIGCLNINVQLHNPHTRLDMYVRLDNGAISRAMYSIRQTVAMKQSRSLFRDLVF